MSARCAGRLLGQLRIRPCSGGLLDRPCGPAEFGEHSEPGEEAAGLSRLARDGGHIAHSAGVRTAAVVGGRLLGSGGQGVGRTGDRSGACALQLGREVPEYGRRFAGGCGPRLAVVRWDRLQLADHALKLSAGELGLGRGERVPLSPWGGRRAGPAPVPLDDGRLGVTGGPPLGPQGGEGKIPGEAEPRVPDRLDVGTGGAESDALAVHPPAALDVVRSNDEAAGAQPADELGLVLRGAGCGPNPAGEGRAVRLGQVPAGSCLVLDRGDVWEGALLAPADDGEPEAPLRLAADGPDLDPLVARAGGTAVTAHQDGGDVDVVVAGSAHTVADGHPGQAPARHFRPTPSRR